MNVFVLGTGRCGTVTFAEACRHITNYTAAHESRAALIRNRLDYPQNHIEVDHRLTFFLGSLHRYYGDAVYVHLTRDPEETAESWSVRTSRQSLMSTWGPAVCYWPRGWPKDLTRLEVARVMVETVTDNIEAFLRDKTAIRMTIEEPHEGFDELWDTIGAEGDRASAHQTLDQVHNERRHP